MKFYKLETCAGGIDMYRYTICNQADDIVFYKQCNALEKYLPGLKKEKQLMDVDGSKTQIYCFKNKKILVHYSFYLDEVSVESEIPIESYFSL